MRGFSGKGSGWGLALAVLLPLTAANAQTDSVTLAGEEAPTAAAEAAPASAITGPIRLEVDVSDRVLRVIAADEVVKTYTVAVGASAHPTPRGAFSIRRLIWNPRWVPPNAAWARGKTPKGPDDPGNPMGRVKLFFSEPDYYIHGTDNQASLGRAESHGCVRMANSDVVELAQLVMEHGGQPRPQSWFHRILNVVRSTNEVRLSTPVSVIVVS
jgi:lipoprotein-anchoring transpeptidase ErfK/SrfK